MEKVRQITKAVLVVFFTLSQLFALRPWGGDFQPSKAVTLHAEPKGDYFHIIMPMNVE